MILANREITNKQEIEDIISRCQTCHVGFVDGDKPYVLAFNFAYDNGKLYIHSAPEGKKNDILKKNNNVCLNFDTDYEIFYRHEQVACSWAMKFRSVVIDGRIEFIESDEEKIRIMSLFMIKYAGRNDFKFNSPAIKNVCVMEVKIDRMTGKKNGY